MDAARQRWIEAHPYLAPVARLDEAVAAALDAAGPAPAVAEPDLAAYVADYHEGVPLLHSEAAALDLAPAVSGLLGELVARLAADERLPEKLREGCRAEAAAWAADPARRLATARWALSTGEEGAPPAQPGLVLFLAWRAAARALAPVVATFAGQRDEARWGHGYCPTCGAVPMNAWLVPGEGVREKQLACGCCGTRWAFQRIGCPHCGEGESNKLSILEVEGEGGLRLDVCDACKGYVKTWAGEGDPSLLLADWTTLHLDVLAKERGYERKGVSLYEL
ncbi:formate dehydrogenase accessory protein FdhE [Anaeromyxobacter paludicola]|uniref:FdhE C-terminal domain-containing protein n=1 Tax=Anaeromyxobacter paludicola TaxID=2918171 RepID=A0ABM7X9K2_9BACT|nr:formate dehydrogenase accessory protein FdhE [Anaeromyxobacter paludicola]BDG08507.1 hypothetical protein AMPC_16200 [Anaeromyxobacter paludicola]